MSRDVKGSFLGVKFVFSRGFVVSLLGCSSRTSCLSRRGVVLEDRQGPSGPRQPISGTLSI
jgi:hypothetical protein